jgi:hypothetical protein
MVISRAEGMYRALGLIPSTAGKKKKGNKLL